MNKPSAPPARRRFQVFYPVYYLLLFVVLLYFRKGIDQSAFALLYLMSAGALLDLTFTQNKRTACLNWLIFATLAGGILLWHFYSAEQFLLSGLCGLAMVALLTALVIRWRRHQ